MLNQAITLFAAAVGAIISGAANAEELHGYAPINGMRMYYEIHGEGRPLVLIHGSYSSIPNSFGALIPDLALKYKVIAVELQGHGRTADIDRPITYENLAGDVVKLLDYLKITQADIYGYSTGAAVALQIAIQHPDRVRKLISASGAYKSSGLYPEALAGADQTTPAMFDGTPWKADYDRLAPNKADFPRLVRQLSKLDATPLDWPASAIAGIKAPVLLIIGDSDIIKPEHALDMFHLLGGGVPGDLKGLPRSQLAVLPGATHVSEMQQTDILRIIVPAFLDAPVVKEN